MKLIDILIPPLSPDREATLEPLRARIDAARLALLAARDEYGVTVERLARLDLVKLQPRVKPDAFNVLGTIRDGRRAEGGLRPRRRAR